MIWGRSGLCNGCARSGFASNSSGFALQSREEAQKYMNVEREVVIVRVCFNVRQTGASVLHAESALGPCLFLRVDHHAYIPTRYREMVLTSSKLA